MLIDKPSKLTIMFEKLVEDSDLETLNHTPGIPAAPPAKTFPCYTVPDSTDSSLTQ